MKLYDTARKGFAEIVPKEAFTIYVCGITPYDSAHLGHIFTFMTYDLLQRLLEEEGMRVKMVRNITDVDEPIYKKAAELGVPYTELAERETASFQKVLQQLNFKKPFAEPKASEFIPQMAEAVQQMIDAGHAYAVDKDIYFDTSTVEHYGGFAGFPEKILLKMLQGRGGDPYRAKKRNRVDFLLWKSIDDPKDPAAWESPVGYGRPGWHIECSVMSESLLGIPFDLHGGGTDLIFPHHESEIAQAHGLGHPIKARYWLHVSPLLLYGEKMSKSLGNLVFAKDLLETYEPAVIRLALMNYHYRSGGEWRPELLESSASLLQAVRAKAQKTDQKQAENLFASVQLALHNNLDTPSVIRALHAFVYAKPTTTPKTVDISPTFNLLGL